MRARNNAAAQPRSIKHRFEAFPTPNRFSFRRGDLIFLKLGHHGGVIFTHVVKPFSTPHFSVRREQQTGW
jgi:hypothetical protein